MRNPVRSSHAESSPNIGDICSVGAEIEPSRSCRLQPQRIPSWHPLAFGNRLLLATIIDPFGKRETRLLTWPKHPYGKLGKWDRVQKSLAGPVSAFVIISYHQGDQPNGDH